MGLVIGTSGSRATHDMGQIFSYSFSLFPQCGPPFLLADSLPTYGGEHGHSLCLLYIFLPPWPSGHGGAILEKALDQPFWVSPLPGWQVNGIL